MGPCRKIACALLIGAAFAASACADEANSTATEAREEGSAERGTAEACEASFAAAPEGAQGVHYVAPSCAGEAQDGTIEAPFETISQAIEAANPGDTLLVESATYAENLILTKEGLSILGEVRTDDAQQVGIILQSPDPNASVIVAGVTGIILQSVHISDPTLAGVWVDGGSAEVHHSSVSGAKVNAEGQYGFGVLATNKAGIILQQTAITGSASTGVLLQNGEGASAVIDCQVDGNGRGGIRLENMPTDTALTGNSLSNNVEVGIGVFSSVGIILQNNGVFDTQIGGPSQSGDGIIVSELKGGDGSSFGPSDVVLGGDAGKADGHLGNTVSGSRRVGILMSGEVAGIILQNEASQNHRAGVWLQSQAGSDEASPGIILQDNSVTDNHFLGISIGAGAEATVENNLITGTREKRADGGVPVIGPDGASEKMGDGLGVFAGATAHIVGNMISGNTRAGILGDGLDVDNTTIADNSYDANATGSIILQNVAPNSFAGATNGEITTLGEGEELDVVKEANDAAGFGLGDQAGIILQ